MYNAEIWVNYKPLSFQKTDKDKLTNLDFHKTD